MSTERPIGRALVLAAPGDSQSAELVAMLAAAGMPAVAVAQATQGFALLCRPPVDAAPIAVAVILGGVSGLPAASVAKAVRSLPGQADLPLVVVGDLPPAMQRCAVLPGGADTAAICRIATAEPATWPPHPMATQPCPEPASPAPTRADGAILVVDDNDVNLLVTSQQARASGRQVETCTDGWGAVERVARGGIALVLMDCQMPIMDGYDATREIRRREAATGGHVPIVAVTAHAMEENRERCLQAGMDDFLSKPLNQEQLFLALRRWLPGSADALPTMPAADATFDPGPMQRLERAAPGAMRDILLAMRNGLVRARGDLVRHLAAGDLTAIAHTAHKLKGSSGSIGAAELAQACAALDRSARNAQADGIGERVSVVVAAIDRLSRRLDAIFGSPPAG